jgi:hypothetical protein
MWRLLKKSFTIFPEDFSHYPSSEEIYHAIKSNFDDSKQKCEFADKDSPLSFRLDGTPYRAVVFSSRSGYYIKCKAI